MTVEKWSQKDWRQAVWGTGCLSSSCFVREGWFAVVWAATAQQWSGKGVGGNPAKVRSGGCQSGGRKECEECGQCGQCAICYKLTTLTALTTLLTPVMRKNFPVAQAAPGKFFVRDGKCLGAEARQGCVRASGTSLPVIQDTIGSSSCGDSCAGASCACAWQSYVVYVFFRKAYCFESYEL